MVDVNAAAGPYKSCEPPDPNISGDLPNEGDLVDLLALFAPDENLGQKILIDNPTRLYGFED
jgi:hypothetical protein